MPRRSQVRERVPGPPPPASSPLTPLLSVEDVPSRAPGRLCRGGCAPAPGAPSALDPAGRRRVSRSRAAATARARGRSASPVTPAPAARRARRRRAALPNQGQGHAGGAGVLPRPRVPAGPGPGPGGSGSVRLPRLRGPLPGRPAAPAGAQRHLVAVGGRAGTRPGRGALGPGGNAASASHVGGFPRSEESRAQSRAGGEGAPSLSRGRWDLNLLGSILGFSWLASGTFSFIQKFTPIGQSLPLQ